MVAVTCGIAAGVSLSLGGSPSNGTAHASTQVNCGAAVGADSGKCPILSTSWGSEPRGWSRAANPAWTTDGKPVLFFYSSLACPYCAASSWVLWFALAQFGNWTGLAYAQSSPFEIFANTSSLNFSNATYSSNWVVTDFWVGANTTSIQVPTLACPESAYYSAYDPGGDIPFFVVNGQFFEVGTLSSPSAFRENPTNYSSPALPAGAVRSEFENRSGPAWQNSTDQIGLAEAAIVIANGGRGPAAVLSNSTVRQDIHNMTAPPPAQFPLYGVIAGSGLGALGSFAGAGFVIRRRARRKEDEAESRNPFRVASITLDIHGEQAHGEPADARAIARGGASASEAPPIPSSDAASDSMADLV